MRISDTSVAENESGRFAPGVFCCRCSAWLKSDFTLSRSSVSLFARTTIDAAGLRLVTACGWGPGLRPCMQPEATIGIKKATIFKHDFEVPCLLLEKSGLATQIYTPEQSGRNYLGMRIHRPIFCKRYAYTRWNQEMRTNCPSNGRIQIHNA